MSYLNKNRKQTDLAVAFLRSNGICVYCGISYDLTFEFEHIYTNKNDANALLSCGLCNRAKASKSLLDTLRGNIERANKLISLLELNFSDSDIFNTIQFLSLETVRILHSQNRALGTSDMRFICTPNGRLSELPNGLKIDATKRELQLFQKYYSLDNLDVYQTD